MDDRKLFGIGAVGTAIALICCFTPALVILFGAIGVSAWLLWIDFVLWPVLAISLAVVVFAGFRLARGGSRPDDAKDTAP